MFFVLKFTFIFLGAFLVHNSTAQEVCPDWLMNKSSSLPECPEGELLPETYPIGAIVVSDIGAGGIDSSFTVDVVQNVLTASGDNHPLLILAASDDTVTRVMAKIDEMPLRDNLKRRIKKSIVQVPNNGNPWQQDYFQPVANPATGKVILRQVEGYKWAGDSFSKIIDATKSCGFEAGPSLASREGKGIYGGNGYLGGNIETLPSGICLLGDVENIGGDPEFDNKVWNQYADQFCNPGSENRIRVSTSWLDTAHLDEIVKVVRNKNSKTPCDFSIVIASPNKAIELLKENPKEKFLDFTGARSSSPSELAAERSGANRLKDLCRKYKQGGQQNAPDYKEESTVNEGAVSILDAKRFFLPEALARPPSKEEPGNCSIMAKITNGEIYRLLTNDKELQLYNQLVQDKMTSLKKEISTKLKRKLPQCTTDFIDAPGIFFGGLPVEMENGKYELPRAMAGHSILPNLANAISVNDTVISPHPSNGIFLNYMKEAYTKRKIKAQFVDTFDLHRAGGNLHCATNTIHLCKPRDL